MSNEFGWVMMHVIKKISPRKATSRETVFFARGEEVAVFQEKGVAKMKTPSQKVGAEL